MRNRPPRITMVLRSLHLGGAERQAVLLANHLHQHRRADIRIVALEPGIEVLKVLSSDIPVRISNPGSGWSPLRAVRLVRFLAGLRRLRPDVLLPFTDWPNKTVNAFWRLTGARASLWNQRDEGREVTGRFIEKRAIRRASWFVVNAPSGFEFLRTRFGVSDGRITLIPNSVRALPAAATRTQWRDRLGLPEATPVVTMVAALTPFKDHQTLLNVWPSVVDRHAGATLLLAGRTEGPFADEIRRHAATDPSIRILGSVEDIGGLLGASDLLVHSSFREGCPNAVLEGMAAGLPVVATDLPGTRMALGEADSTLVPARDPAALAAAVGSLLANPDRRDHLGSKNRHRAAACFSQERVTDSWMAVIDALVERRPPEPIDTVGPTDR